MIYKNDWLDRYKNPLYKDNLAQCSHRTTVANSSCGDEIELMLNVRGKRVEKAVYQGKGCVMSNVSADLLCEYIVDKVIDDIQAIDESKWLEMFPDLSPGRYNCVLLSLRALKEILDGSK